MNFFAPPIDQDSLMKLKLLASVPLRNVEQLLWAGLHYFFNKKEKLQLNVDIRGPIVCVTDRSLNPQPFILTNFGSLQIQSHNKDSGLSPSDSMTHLSENNKPGIYDRFSVISKDFQILIGRSLEEVFEGLNSSKISPHHLFSPTSFELELLNYRNEQTPDAGTLTVIGSSPGIVLKTTEWQYRASLFLTNEVLNSLVRPVRPLFFFFLCFFVSLGHHSKRLC